MIRIDPRIIKSAEKWGTKEKQKKKKRVIRGEVIYKAVLAERS